VVSIGTAPRGLGGVPGGAYDAGTLHNASGDEWVIMGVKTDIGFCNSTANLQMGCAGCELWNGRDRHKCHTGHLTRYASTPGWPMACDQPRLFLHRLDTASHWPNLMGKESSDNPSLSGLPSVINEDGGH
jgi:hypothetical protein